MTVISSSNNTEKLEGVAKSSRRWPLSFFRDKREREAPHSVVREDFSSQSPCSQNFQLATRTVRGATSSQGAHCSFTVAARWLVELQPQQPAAGCAGPGPWRQAHRQPHRTSIEGTAHQLTVTINGTDDKAQIGGTATGVVTEETALHTGGQLTITDPDAGQDQFVAQPNAQGAHGSFTVQPDGSWSYSLNNQQPAVQGLAHGDQLTDSLTVTSIDGTAHQLTVTINGTDDKAQIGGTATGRSPRRRRFTPAVSSPSPIPTPVRISSWRSLM
nr:VCBS domain-containing protein [Pseudovibrio sp. M1P-2-3]